VAKHATIAQTEWNTYIAYARSDSEKETLFIVVDRVTVDASLELTDRINILHGIGQSNYLFKDYKTMRIAVNEKTQFLAICAQVTLENTDGSTSSKNIFISVGLAGDIAEVRPIQVKIVDSSIGSEFECAATSLNDVGDTAYFLLNDSNSHKT
jgi:hypothetical protein